MFIKRVNILVILLAFSHASSAGLITFDGLTGSNADPYFGHVEDGYQITAVGNWREAHMFGSPVPSIFGRSSVGSIELTAIDRSLFTFSSIDLADAFPSSPVSTISYSVKGLLNGTSQFSFSGDWWAGFTTINNADNNVAIDFLEVSITRGLVTYNIDNISVESVIGVPEPGSTPLILTGLFGIFISRRFGLKENQFNKVQQTAHFVRCTSSLSLLRLCARYYEH